MLNLYIIAGCNGAGKTTASFTILPEMLNCKEFVNADSIAEGLSPFNPESVAFEAGRIMLQRIHELMKTKVDFAFETTLATRSYVSFLKNARNLGYRITLLFFGYILLVLYTPICDTWMIVDNRGIIPELVAQGIQNGESMILNSYTWNTILAQSKQNGKQ